MKKKIADLFTQSSGKALKKSNQIGTLHKYITTSNLFWGHFDFSEVREMYFSDSEVEKCTAKKGDLLVCNGGDVGRAAVWNYDYDICLQNHVTRLRKICDNLNPFYYYYFFKFVKQNNLIEGNGVGIESLSAKEILNIKVPFPSQNEQNQIVKKLDSIQSAIDNKKQQLALLHEAVKSKFVEMFGENPVESGKWKVEKLKALSKSGGTYGAQSASSEYKNNRPRYIRITDINEDGSLNDDVVCSSNNDDDNTYKLVKGDFLFARMGATVGKTYAYSSGDMIFAGYLIRFQLNTEKIHPSFLFYFTKTEWYQKWVKNNQSGAAQPGINSNKYGNLSVPVPPLNLQNQFAAFVQQIDKSKSLVKQQIADLQELLDSKMNEYFGG